MTIELVEIIGRSVQGMTQPFICRAENGFIYFVKGRGAGRRSQICEWIAGQLALRLELPIAPFDLLNIATELVSIDFRDDLGELGAGPAFGSRKLPGIELTISQLALVPEQVQRDVLVFDWWVSNADRNLNELCGNPNLLWDNSQKQLVVIDHNLAFDSNFSAEKFSGHVFWGRADELLQNKVLQQEYEQRFAQAMSEWDAICSTVPAEWWFLDSEQTLPTDFDCNFAKQMLQRYQENGFWSLK